MRMGGLSYNSGTENRYRYNGKEYHQELGLGLYDYGARMYDPAIGRFTTQDRFSEKYFGMAPYQYAANNPILFVDVNGDSIWIQVSSNERYLYENGQLFQDGSNVTQQTLYKKNGKRRKNFISKAVNALDATSDGGESGNELISELQDSRINTVIKKGSGNSTGTEKGEVIVGWNPGSKKGGLNENGKTDRPAFIGLVHELAHSFDWISDNTIDGDPWYTPSGATKPRTDAEKFAVHIENLIRMENNLPLRTHDGTTSSSPAYTQAGYSLFHSSTVKSSASTAAGMLNWQIVLPFRYGRNKGGPLRNIRSNF